MKKFICLCLANEFGNQICEKVANDLNMYYLNLDKFIQYSLFDSSEMLIRCGKNYYDKQEEKVINESLDYTNTLYFSSYETYIKNKDKFTSFNIIYIYLNLKQLDKLQESNIIINRIAFNDRDKYLEPISIKIENQTLTQTEFVTKIKAVLEAKR